MSRSADILAKLIAYPTVSRDGNLDLIAYARNELEALGFSCTLVPSEDGAKANLLATAGPQDRPGIVLSGHTDVVPVEGQDWTSDPFKMRTANGRLYGRGTSDMKGFIACCLSLAHDVKAQKLAMPLQFAFSYDEEIGCLGVRRLIAMMRDLPVRPRFCIVGEPTSMQVVTAHKGKVSWRVHCAGLEAHSSLAPTGVNAIYMAADLISQIRALQARVERDGARDGDYEVAYTTLHTGTIAGGEALNIVPNQAGFEFEIRNLPDDDPEPLMQEIHAAARRIEADARKIYPDAAIRFEPISEYPAFDCPPDTEVISFVKSLTGGNSTGKVSFGTEAGLFQSRLEVPTVVCGPGSIAQAHKADEFIALSEMNACDAFLRRLLERISA